MTYDLGLDIPDTLKLFQLSEQHRRLVVINVQGLRRKEGSLLPEYTDEEFAEATFIVREVLCAEPSTTTTLVEENKKLRYELDQEMEWKTRTERLIEKRYFSPRGKRRKSRTGRQQAPGSCVQPKGHSPLAGKKLFAPLRRCELCKAF